MTARAIGAGSIRLSGGFSREASRPSLAVGSGSVHEPTHNAVIVRFLWMHIAPNLSQKYGQRFVVAL
jgi:hypothetical protein